METILVTMDKSAEEYVSEAKQHLDKHGEINVKGISRDTVKAVDVAELLKIEGFKVRKIEIKTEEKTISEENSAPKTLRHSTIEIELHK